MKSMKKRLMSLFLAIVLLLSALPAGVITSSAAGGVKAKLDAVIASYPSGSRWTGSFDGGTQCYGFAKMVTYKIFGTYSGRYRSWTYAGVSTSGMNTVGSITSYSSANVKSLMSNAKCGDVLQFNTPNQHSMVVYSVSSNDFKVYDCNSDLNCGVKLRTISFGSWSGKNSTKLTLLRSDNYASIDGTPAVHTHSFSGSSFEGAHPHKVYQRCSCGATRYTGATTAYHNCSTCMKGSWDYVGPCKAYTINTGKTVVYNAVNGTAKSNKIYDTDLCTISQFYDCGWCKVTFPLNSGGTDTGYVQTSVFMPKLKLKIYAGSQITTYRRSDLKQSAGCAGSGDNVWIASTTSNAVQIIYPLSSGGYKAGWIPISAIKCNIAYNADGGKGSMSTSTVQYNGKISLASNKFTKDGYSFYGWNVYRASDKKWYVSGEGWKTASEISSKGYTKKLYNNNWSGTFDDYWMRLGKTNDTFTFYAVWTPNILSVSYNANGGKITSDTYKLSNNLVYRSSNNDKLVHTWKYDIAQQDGLYNAKTFGLTRDGYTFKGWGTTASGGTIFDQDDSTLVPTKINANIKTGNCSTTLYAIWEKDPYTITYDANGGKNAPSSQKTGSDGTFVFTSATPTKDGYTFLGWNYTKDAITPLDSSIVAPGKKVSVDKNTTFYAVWEKTEQPVVHTHEWNSDYTVDKQATCTENGVKSIHCKTCGETKDTVIIQAKGHSFKDVVIKEATCTEEGLKVKECAICGYETDNTVIPTEKHNFVTTVLQEATCDKEGTKADVCSVCGCVQNKTSIPTEEHEFGEWEVEKEATAENDGVEIRKCRNCNYVETRTIEFIPTYDEDAPRITMSSVNAKVAEEVELSINIENNPGITALRLKLDYDESVLEMTDFKFAEALSSMNKGTSENYASGYSFSMYSATADLTDCGSIAKVKFKVKEGVEDGEYPIKITYDEDDIFNLTGDSISFDTGLGVITVSSCLPGDVNSDGKTNMRDVVLLQQVINAWSVVYSKEAADFNGDGKINMRDIVALQQYING